MSPFPLYFALYFSEGPEHILDATSTVCYATHSKSLKEALPYVCASCVSCPSGVIPCTDSFKSCHFWDHACLSVGFCVLVKHQRGCQQQHLGNKITWKLFDISKDCWFVSITLFFDYSEMKMMKPGH